MSKDTVDKKRSNTTTSRRSSLMMGAGMLSIGAVACVLLRLLLLSVFDVPGSAANKFVLGCALVLFLSVVVVTAQEAAKREGRSRLPTLFGGSALMALAGIGGAAGVVFTLSRDAPLLALVIAISAVIVARVALARLDQD